MAKLALLTLTVFFIALFFTISTSKPQHPLDLPDDDSARFHDPSITLPEPDSKRTILLPSEKPESVPATMVELEQNEKHESEMEIVEEEEVDEKPEMKMAYRDLRPVWPRNVDQRMMFVLRHPHHRCHHPHRRPDQRHDQMLFRLFDVERREPERSYGNDMLVADPEMERGFGNLENDMLVADPEMEKGFENREGNLENDMLVADPEMEKRFKNREGNLENDMLVADPEMEQDLTEIHVGDGGGRRHAPSRWVGFHFGGRPRFPDDRDHHEHGPHHHHHHHYQHDEDEEHRHEHRPDEEDHRDHHHPHPYDEVKEHRHEHRPDEDRREHHREENEKRPFGLVKRFRKFLHQIDF